MTQRVSSAELHLIKIILLASAGSYGGSTFHHLLFDKQGVRRNTAWQAGEVNRLISELPSAEKAQVERALARFSPPRKILAVGEEVPRRKPGEVAKAVLGYFDKHPTLSSPQYADALDVPAETVRAILSRNGRQLATARKRA